MKTIFLLFTLFIGVQGYTQKNSCMQDSICRTQAASYASLYIHNLAVLGVCPVDPALANQKLEALKNNFLSQYESIFILKSEIGDWADGDSNKKRSVTSFIRDMNTIDWVNYINTLNVTVQPTSPEFCRGSGLHLDYNFGSTDAFGKYESVARSAHLLYAYTFAKNDCGGRIRLLLGPSYLRYAKKDFVMGTLRMEIRLKDIMAGSLGGIAVIKLLLQSSVNDIGFVAGPGIGLELGKKVSVQYLTQFLRMYKKNTYALQLGIGYRFFK